MAADEINGFLFITESHNAFLILVIIYTFNDNYMNHAHGN